MALIYRTINGLEEKIQFEAGSLIGNEEESVHFQFKKSYPDCQIWTGRLLRDGLDINPKQVIFKGFCKINQHDSHKGTIEIINPPGDGRKSHVLFQIRKPYYKANSYKNNTNDNSCPVWTGRFMRSTQVTDPPDTAFVDERRFPTASPTPSTNSGAGHQAASVQSGDSDVQNTNAGQPNLENNGNRRSQTPRASVTPTSGAQNAQRQSAMVDHPVNGYGVVHPGMPSPNGAAHSPDLNGNRHPGQNDDFLGQNGHPSNNGLGRQNARPPQSQDPTSFARGGDHANGGNQMHGGGPMKREPHMDGASQTYGGGQMNGGARNYVQPPGH